MSVPADQMSPDQMNLMMALMRRNQGPLAWDQTQSDGSNAGGQRSQTGMSNMMMPLAQALMKSRAPKTYDMQGLPDGAFSEAVPNAGGLSEFAPGDLSALGGGAPAGGGAGGGAGATAAGLGAGVGAFGVGYGLSRMLASTGNRNAKDVNRDMAGHIATGEQRVAQLQAQGDTAGAAQAQTHVDDLYAQIGQYRNALGLPTMTNPNNQKDAHGLTWNQQYISDHSGSGGPRKIL